MGTTTVQTLPERVIGVLDTSQSLKSPTKVTCLADGATKLNFTNVSETGSFETAATGGCPAVGRPSRLVITAPAKTPMPTRPAARSVLRAGDNVSERGSANRWNALPTRLTNERCGTGSARTAAIKRSRAPASMTTGRRASRAIHSTYELCSESVILD